MSISMTNEEGTVQLATFYLDGLRFGIDITEIQEINRQHSVTKVAHTARHVRGVINLRGEVVSVLDLRVILNLGEAAFGRSARNIILHGDGEPVGLLVDSLSDVVNVELSELEPAPANIAGVDARFMLGIQQMASELLVVLRVDELAALQESGSRNQ